MTTDVRWRFMFFFSLSCHTLGAIVLLLPRLLKSLGSPLLSSDLPHYSTPPPLPTHREHALQSLLCQQLTSICISFTGLHLQVGAGGPVPGKATTSNTAAMCSEWAGKSFTWWGWSRVERDLKLIVKKKNEKKIVNIYSMYVYIVGFPFPFISILPNLALFLKDLALCRQLQSNGCFRLCYCCCLWVFV